MYLSTNNESSYEYMREDGIIHRLQTRIAAMRDNSQPSSRVSTLHRNYTNRSIVRSYLESLNTPVNKPFISGVQALTPPSTSTSTLLELQSCSTDKPLNGARACPVDTLAKEKPPPHRHVKKGRGKTVRHRPCAKSMRRSPAASPVSADVRGDSDTSPEAGFSLGPASLSSADDVLSIDGRAASMNCGGPSSPWQPIALDTVTARSIFPAAADTCPLECLSLEHLSPGSATTCLRMCSQAEPPVELRAADVRGDDDADRSAERPPVPRELLGLDADARVAPVCVALAPAAPESTCAVFAAITAASSPAPLCPAMLLLRDRQLHVFLAPSREPHAHTLPDADVQARLCAGPPSLSLHLCAALVTVDAACPASALVPTPHTRAATPAGAAHDALTLTLWPLRVRSQRGPPRALTLAWPSAHERDLWVPRLCACLAFVHAQLDYLPLLPPALRQVPMGLSDNPAAVQPPGVAEHTNADAPASATAHLPRVSLLTRALGTRLRPLVSKKKRRFVSGAFDLDLTYVTSRVLAMGFPASGREAWYRNARPDVQRFLAARHSHYRVYNLCSERAYPEDTFPSACHFPFDDHAPCSFADLLFLVHDMQQWMHAHPDGVLAVHCKAGKGRTGLAIAALLVYTHTLPRAADALRYYGLRRTRNGKGVTIPSQARWVHMLEVLLARTNATHAVEAGTPAATGKTPPHVCVGAHGSGYAHYIGPEPGPEPVPASLPVPALPPLRVLRLVQVSMCDAPPIDALLVRCRGEEHVFPLASLSAQGRLHSRTHTRPHTHLPVGDASASISTVTSYLPPPHAAALDAAEGRSRDDYAGYESADNSNGTHLAVASAERAWRVPGDGHVQTDVCDGQREVCLHLPWRPLGALCATAREREAWHVARGKVTPCGCFHGKGHGAIPAPDYSPSRVATLAESRETERSIRHALETHAESWHSDESTCGVCVSTDIQVEGMRGGKTVWLCWLHTQFVDAAGRRVLLRKCDLDVANKNKALSDFVVELLFSSAI